MQASICNFDTSVQSDISAESSKPKPSTLEAPVSSPQPAKSPAGRNSRTTRRPGTQQVRLEALDDSLGPLGPLGDNAPIQQADQPPAPPQKEQTLTHNARQPVTASQSSMSRSMLDSVDLSDDVETAAGPRIPPPVQPPQNTPLRRDTHPSVSIEQAAKPTFDITVGDPHKVGDLTSSHIVYLVRTKVLLAPCSNELSVLTQTRLPPKPTANPNSPLQGDTGTSYGCIPLYMRTTLESSYLHLPRNKQLGDLIPISSSHGELPWNEC